MPEQDLPIRHFQAMVDLATSLKAVPALVLDSSYSYEAFGSWSITFRCKGVTARVVYDGKEQEVSFEHSRTRKAPHEWDEVVWRRAHPSGDLDAALRADIIHTVDYLFFPASANERSE
jgi:hypothetical protein